MCRQSRHSIKAKLIQLKSKMNRKRNQNESQTKEIPDELRAEIYADDLCIKERIKL